MLVWWIFFHYIWTNVEILARLTLYIYSSLVWQPKSWPCDTQKWAATDQTWASSRQSVEKLATLLEHWRNPHARQNHMYDKWKAKTCWLSLCLLSLFIMYVWFYQTGNLSMPNKSDNLKIMLQQQICQEFLPHVWFHDGVIERKHKGMQSKSHVL